MFSTIKLQPLLIEEMFLIKFIKSSLQEYFWEYIIVLDEINCIYFWLNFSFFSMCKMIYKTNEKF